MSAEEHLKAIRRQGEPLGELEQPPEKQWILYANRSNSEGLWYWRRDGENVPAKPTMRGYLEDVYAYWKEYEAEKHEDGWRLCVQLRAGPSGRITIEMGLGVTAGRSILAQFAEASDWLLDYPVSIEAKAGDEDEEALLLNVYCNYPVFGENWPGKNVADKRYLQWLQRIRQKVGFDGDWRRVNVYGAPAQDADSWPADSQDVATPNRAEILNCAKVNHQSTDQPIGEISAEGFAQDTIGRAVSAYAHKGFERSQEYANRVLMGVGKNTFGEVPVKSLQLVLEMIEDPDTLQSQLDKLPNSTG